MGPGPSAVGVSRRVEGDKHRRRRSQPQKTRSCYCPRVQSRIARSTEKTAVTFSDGQWSVLGNASDVRRSDERRVILDALVDNNGPMTPAQLTAATGQPGTNIRQLLLKMAKNGEVYKVCKGRYRVKPYTDNSDHTDNSGEDD